MKHVRYREDIDALRGVAVLLVVIYHSFPDFLPGGFIGVDVFFVISGFLITSIMLLSLRKNDFLLTEFYVRRIRRLFPALITILVFVLLLGWLVLFPDEYKQLGAHVGKSVVFWLNFTLIDEAGYFDVESHYKPLLHLWTLSVEEQYYLFWPLILLLFLKYNRQPIYLFGLVFLVSLLVNLYFAQDYTQETYYHTLSRFWQLSTGSLLAVVLLNKQVSANRFLLLTGVIIVVLSAGLINSEMVYPGYWAMLPVFGASMVILANAQLPTYMGLSKLGVISYPLYLWHWVLISFLYIYLGRKPSDSTLIIIVFLSLLLSYLTYQYIERLRFNKAAAPYLIVSLVLVGLCGVYISQNKGMPDRAHISYFVESPVEFKRIPAKDKDCIEYSNNLLKEEHAFNYCRGDNIWRSKLVAIIGDSHGHVLFPGVSEFANKNGYGTILLANSSCPPLKGFMWGKNPKDVAECQLKINQIIKIIEKEKRIEKVVFVTRGPVYIHGEVEGYFTDKSVEKSLSKTKQKTLTYKTYFEGFNSTIKKIESITHIKSVYYMLENPELDFIPKEVIPRPFDAIGVSTNRNYMSRDLYLKRMSYYREGLKKLESNKMVYLDPINIMCDKTKCYSFLEGGFLYADDDHFSVYGSRFIVNKFKVSLFGE